MPTGAVLVNENKAIVYRGRNRVNEIYAPEYQTCSNRLAHAEINVLLQVRQTDSDTVSSHVLHTTTEPCVLCFGAIVMSGVRSIRYAASDPVAGGTGLSKSTNTFILNH
ncbi:nucleoside deaminase [Alicyclobacillus fastidiosus]|uniref:nucleoside deaminase n=1 Tax=Alicyclobacillus fastidiosus TaxID=392011 RepID=UPI0034DDC26E